MGPPPLTADRFSQGKFCIHLSKCQKPRSRRTLLVLASVVAWTAHTTKSLFGISRPRRYGLEGPCFHLYYSSRFQAESQAMALRPPARFLDGYTLNSFPNAYPVRLRFWSSPAVQGFSSTITQIYLARFGRTQTRSIWVGLPPDRWASKSTYFGSRDARRTYLLVREDFRVIGARSRLLHPRPSHFDRLGPSELDDLWKHPPNVLRDREVEPP